MATHSFIAQERFDGSFEGVYCHWDGHPTGNGEILMKHYSDPAKVAYLLSFGSMSCLGADIGEQHSFEDQTDGSMTTFYGRDRGETDVGSERFDTIEDLILTALNWECEYIYVQKANGWWFTERTSEYLGMNDGSFFGDLIPLECVVSV